jgi:hypothetical protein
MELTSINEFLYPEEAYRGVKQIEVPPYDLILFDVPRLKITKFINDNRNLFLDKSVVYILFNKELNNDGKREVYIGKSSNFMNRKSNHLENKDFWTNALIFTSNYFTESAIVYLENRITDLARHNSSLDVKTISTQASGQVRMQDKRLYDQYAGIITELLKRREYWLGSSKTNNNEMPVEADFSSSDVFYITKKSAFDEPQPMFISGDKYIIRKGTKISRVVQKSIERPYGPLSRQLEADGIISREKGEFLQDYIFDSPSAAACVIVGGSVSGPKEWKTKDGTSLRDC